MEEHVASTQVEPPSPQATTEDTTWSDLGGLALAITVLAFLIPYVWLAIRRFDKQIRP
ncbi:MAG: hypothetical protein AB7G28_17590 [Pirellulales bacterium]